MFPQQCVLVCHRLKRRQCGQVVSVLDSQYSSHGFESHSDYYLDLFHGSPKFESSAMLVNRQLVCPQPVGIVNNIMFNLKCLFQLFALPHYFNYIFRFKCDFALYF